MNTKFQEHNSTVEIKLSPIRRYLICIWTFLFGRIRTHHHISAGSFNGKLILWSILLPKRLKSEIGNVGSHEFPDALIVRSGALTPSIFRWGARRRIANEFSEMGKPNNRWAKRAARQVQYMLQAVGYVPLVQVFDPLPNYMAYAIGIEYHSRRRFSGYPIQLPFQASTSLPWLPFGPAFFGHESSRFPAAYSPDILVFVALDKHETAFSSLIKVGPRVFPLGDLIKDHLSTQVVKRLAQPVFTISSNARLGVFPRETQDDIEEFDNRFGSINDISLLGGSEGHRYFRIDCQEGRMQVGSNFGEAGDQAALDSLRNALLRMENACHRIDLNRGDILIVNNRRVATLWDDEAPLITPQVAAARAVGWAVHGKEKPLKPGDRTILQFSFYFPEFIEASSGDNRMENKEPTDNTP